MQCVRVSAGLQGGILHKVDFILSDPKKTENGLSVALASEGSHGFLSTDVSLTFTFAVLMERSQ